MATQSALPRPNDFSPGVLHDAYGKCLDLEKNSQQGQGDSDHDTGPLLTARFLGYLLREIPGDSGREHLANEIVLCVTDGDMSRIARYYMIHFVLVFKRGITPPPLEHPSRPHFYEQGHSYHDILQNAQLDHYHAKKYALARDRYLCCFTGNFDLDVYNSPDFLTWTQEPGSCARGTDAAHIIPDISDAGIARRIGNSAFHNTKYASTVWTVLSRFSGDVTLLDHLAGHRIHSLENILTMDCMFHKMFDNLNVWLEPTDIPNIYRRCGNIEASFYGLPRTVTLESSDPQLPLPSPVYIRLHAACARVANLSGAMEYIDSFWRDMENARVLAHDGSSMKLLQALSDLRLF
ncbi:hypothetical protein CPB84DRAFT_1845472 [Gymnopilus junonius]|uniref:HNH nuclease domain-containing protein n=1 Tax=Gymnopilus junonius TaxID=109634 RepID=A0A9P5NTM2_GYMJU|nr:hypothetical protein CPB84DRAFT_1845472 [Gymnopilus junonius]